jgi:hypothetical protein
MEGENVSIMSSWPLYTGSNYMNYSLNWENETALYRQWLVIYIGYNIFLILLCNKNCLLASGKEQKVSMKSMQYYF